MKESSGLGTILRCSNDFQEYGFSPLFQKFSIEKLSKAERFFVLAFVFNMKLQKGD